MKRLIIFLIRKRLGVKKVEPFQFDNQKTNNVYFFTEFGVMKRTNRSVELSSVSLNWLLDDECKIIRRDDPRWQE